MTANDFHVVIECEQFGLDGTQYLVMIPTWQVSPPDRVQEQSVARHELVFRWNQETDTSLSVTGRVKDGKGRARQLQRIAVPQARVDLDVPGLLHAEPGSLVAQPVDQHQIPVVHVHRSARELAQLARSANVVDVGMRDGDPPDRQPMPVQDGPYPLNLVPRIDNDRLTGRHITEDQAVALQWTDRKNLQNHRWYPSNSAVGGLQELWPDSAWGPLPARGRLRATGEDRERLLHAISSNIIEGLSPGQGTYAFFLDAQGRIRSDGRIFVDADHILIDCELGAARALREHIERYIIMDDVVLEDVSGSDCLLAVCGPKSRETVSSLFGGVPSGTLEFGRFGKTRVFRVPVGTMDGYWIQAPPSDVGRLTADLESTGAVAASDDDFEILRVAHLVPRFGQDFGPANIPHETQQMHAVSFSKGCYTGQEIVERVRSQGQVRQALVGLDLQSRTAPEDLTVYHLGKAVGTMTSPTPEAAPNGMVRGFAMVRREAARPGTSVLCGQLPGRTLDTART